MTKDDEANEIGRMYVERENVQRRLACLDNQSRRLEATLREAADAMKQRREDGGNTAIDRDFPSREQIASIMSEQAEAQARLRELNAFFEARGT